MTEGTRKKVIDLKHPTRERWEREEFSEEPASYREVLIEWEAPEYRHAPKSRNWFFAGGILAFALIIVAILARNYFFGIFIVVASFVVLLYAVRPPRKIAHAVTSEGVQIGQRLFLFEDLKSFWIFYEVGGIKELSLESKKSLMPYLRAGLGETNPAALRETLVRFIPETQHEESLAEVLARLVGF